MSIRLSQRLQRIANYIQPGSRVADVGTDHALLPIYLVVSGQSNYVIATDVAQGPVDSALSNVQRHRCSKQISVRCGDGLQTVEPGEVDTVVMAGMGGGTAVDILQRAPVVVERLRRLVIQPMNASRQVREFLLETDFGLVDECLFIDDGRYYEILVADRDGACHDSYRDYHGSDSSTWLALQFGPFILRQGDTVLQDYLEEQCRSMQNTLKGLEQGKSEAAKIKKQQVQQHLNWLRLWLEKQGGNG